jgi:hypothetical protein
MASALGGEDTWRLLATSFDVTELALQMTKVQSTNHRPVLIYMNFGV